MFLDQKSKLFVKQQKWNKKLFFWKIKKKVQIRPGGPGGGAPRQPEKRLWTKSNYLSHKYLSQTKNRHETGLYEGYRAEN